MGAYCKVEAVEELRHGRKPCTDRVSGRNPCTDRVCTGIADMGRITLSSIFTTK